MVAAARQAITEQTSASTGTHGSLRLRVEHLLAAEHRPGCVAPPPKTTFHRLLAALQYGQHTVGAANHPRSLANRPDAPFGSVHAARPGELAQIDTTALDVMAVLDDGVTGRVELTMLVDLATRTICSGVLRPHGTKAVDAALLLPGQWCPNHCDPAGPRSCGCGPRDCPH